jgi:hypothetical protein
MIPKPLEKLLMNRRHLDWTGFRCLGGNKKLSQESFSGG